MGVGFRSPKKASGFCPFLSFGRQSTKKGDQMRGAEVLKTALFLTGPPFGCPWKHKATKMDPSGAKLTSGAAPNCGFWVDNWS